MFEKYSKKRSDPDFCDEDRGGGGGIGHSSKLMYKCILYMYYYYMIQYDVYDVYDI